MSKKKRRKKKHTGRIVFLALLVVIAAGLFFGRGAIGDGIKAKVTKTVAQKLLEEQIQQAVSTGNLNLGEADPKEIIDQMSQEDVQTVTEIAEKYVDSESLSEYLDMARNGEISEIKEQAKEQLTEADRQELKNIYEKYKDQIPSSQIP